MRTYPPWAPPVLKEKHRALVSELDKYAEGDHAEEARLRARGTILFLTVQERLKLIEALLSRPMKDVWSSLERRRAQFESRLPEIAFERNDLQESPHPVESMEGTIQARREQVKAVWRSQAVNLLDACEATLLGVEMIPKTDTGSARKSLLQVAEHAEGLAEALRSARWHEASESDLGMAGVLDPRPDNKAESMPDLLGLSADSVLRNFFEAPGHKKHDPFMPGSDPWSNLPDFLVRLAELARKRAKDPPKTKGQPHVRQAGSRQFQIELSRYFARAYGLPLYKQVAQITSAVFQTHVSEGSVRKLVKYRAAQKRDPETTAR
jgi:hypothetical protein